MTIIDGSGAVMGRLASHVAKRLLGGEEIHIINCEGVLISGRRKALISRYLHKREIGSTRKGPYYPRMPHRIFKRAVRGMVKYQQPSGRAALKRLRVHIGTPPELEGKDVESIDDAVPKGSYGYMKLGDLSEALGAKFR